jgi:hypothetical protein
MGYRNYIGSLPRAEYDFIKSFTKEELFKYKNQSLEEDDDGHIGVYDVASKELYELGKYSEVGGVKFFSPVFENEELQKYFDDEHDFYIVNKEFLKHVIEHYTQKVKDFYSKLLKGIEHKDSDKIDSKKAYELYEHIRGNASEWLQLTPYNLDNDSDEITTSWKFEYSIFELVRIYKTFDWENEVMIYYGY